MCGGVGLLPRLTGLVGVSSLCSAKTPVGAKPGIVALIYIRRAVGVFEFGFVLWAGPPESFGHLKFKSP